MGIIALITDYGTSDWFAGEMKGAILRVAPNVAIVDISHNIPAGDISGAAFSLLACYRSFPAGTVFCVVVDPGVGTGRAAIVAKNGSFFFTGPDNGVLSWALKAEKTAAVRCVGNPELLPASVSQTFHGRDIFGPIAALLSEKPEIFDTIGPVLPGIIELPWPACVHDKKYLLGSIVHIDRFGNAITTVDENSLKLLANIPAKVRMVKYGTELPLCSYFQQVPSGQGLAYVGSAGYVEIAINNANAAAIFGLQIGDKIEVL